MTGTEKYIGATFGRWTIVEYLGRNKNSKKLFQCICSCGTKRAVLLESLKRNKSTSCGCLRLERAADAKTKHNGRYTRLYNIWAKMKARCQNENDRNYKNYGARGITVCDEWNKSFDTFRTFALDNGYNDSLSIDRINVNGNYEPSNCRFVDMKTQQNNRSNNRLITLDNKAMTLSELCDIYKIDYEVARMRLNRGWTIERILNTPIGQSSQEKLLYATIGGVTRSVKEWAEIYGIKHKTIITRINRGWSAEDAITKPVIPRKANK